MVSENILSRNPVRSMAMTAFGLLLLLPTGCKRDSGDKPAADAGSMEKKTEVKKPRPTLVSADERKALEDEFMKSIEKNRTLACPRPVLRGEPLEGSATEDMVAVIEGTEDTQACLSLLEDKTDFLNDALGFPDGQRPEGYPVRPFKTARFLDDPVNGSLPMKQVLEDCAPLIARVRKAVRHPDACSPFLAGLRGEPGMISHIRAARVLAAAARAKLLDAKMGEAVDILLDGLRFGQDMSRGGSNMLVAMVGVAATQALFPVLELALNHPKPLGEKLLTRLDSELAALLETEIHPSGILQGEIETMVLYTLMPAVKGEGWAPPGGWGKDQKGPDEKTNTLIETKVIGADERDDMAVTWIAMKETWDEMQKACPADALPFDCTRAMVKNAEEAAAKEADLDKLRRLLDVATSKDKLAAVRRQIIDILKSIAAPSYNRYLSKLGQPRFHLAAFRLAAAYRKLAEKTKSCPGLEAFDQEPLSALMTDPYSKQAIKTSLVAAGEKKTLLLLQAPVELEAGKPTEEQPALVVECPYGEK